MADFEDIFLCDNEKQIKIRFNPKISSFKTTRLESKIDTIGGNSKNRGITFSNDSMRETVIVIGETTCPAQFSHSFDHEKHHLAMHIAKVDGIDPFGEELAYLVGEIGYQTFPIAKRFLCEHCRIEMQ